MSTKKGEKNLYLPRARKQENAKFSEACRDEVERSGINPLESANAVFGAIVQGHLDNDEDIDIKRTHPNILIIKHMDKK